MFSCLKYSVISDIGTWGKCRCLKSTDSFNASVGIQFLASFAGSALNEDIWQDEVNFGGYSWWINLTWKLDSCYYISAYNLPILSFAPWLVGYSFISVFKDPKSDSLDPLPVTIIKRIRSVILYVREAKGLEDRCRNSNIKSIKLWTITSRTCRCSFHGASASTRGRIWAHRSMSEIRGSVGPFRHAYPTLIFFCTS